jgi:hypothetical protein
LSSVTLYYWTGWSRYLLDYSTTIQEAQTPIPLMKWTLHRVQQTPLPNRHDGWDLYYENISWTHKMKQPVFMTCVYFCQKPPQSIALRFQFQQRSVSSVAGELRLATHKIDCFAGYITAPLYRIVYGFVFYELFLFLSKATHRSPFILFTFETNKLEQTLKKTVSLVYSRTKLNL